MSEPQPPATSAASLREMLLRLGPAAPMAIAVSVLPPLGLTALLAILSTTSLATTMREHPSAAIPIYTASFWALGLCVLPTYAYSVLGGWAFGFWPGIVAASLAYAGAMCLAFAIARRVASARVLPLIDEHPTLAAVRRAIVDAPFWRETLLIALLRISPVSPFAITNVVLGASGVRWWPYVFGSALGVLPRTAAVVWVASRSAELSFKTADGWWMLGIGIVATLIAIGVIAKFARRELDRQLTRREAIAPSPAPTAASPGASRCPPPSESAPGSGSPSGRE